MRKEVEETTRFICLASSQEWGITLCKSQLCHEPQTASPEPFLPSALAYQQPEHRRSVPSLVRDNLSLDLLYFNDHLFSKGGFPTFPRRWDWKGDWRKDWRRARMG
jgi:hypothetical protein